MTDKYTVIPNPLDDKLYKFALVLTDDIEKAKNKQFPILCIDIYKTEQDAKDYGAKLNKQADMIEKLEEELSMAIYEIVKDLSYEDRRDLFTEFDNEKGVDLQELY